MELSPFCEANSRSGTLTKKTHSMELSPFCEANSRSGTQEILNILWNLKVYYRIHKSPPLGSIVNPIHKLHPISSVSILILSSASNSS
jgi:hypothetical protein